MAKLRVATREGDWALAQASAELLAAEPLPREPEELGRRLEVLKELLTSARAGRAHLAATLQNVTAASRFGQSPEFERQNLVDPIRI